MQDISVTGESMTGGVGTTFYRAPEQETQEIIQRTGRNSSYTVKADIFSFGIILFEMFHPPFKTYMERAGTLSILRGDHSTQKGGRKLLTNNGAKDLPDQAVSRLPDKFVKSVPQNAQRLTLLCLDREPNNRPSAKDILAGELLPRKIELEQKYLEEALEILTSSQSESNVQILNALFAKPVNDIVDMTFDTDIAVKANSIGQNNSGRRQLTPSQVLMNALLSIRAGAVDAIVLGSLAMSASPTLAATAALKRAALTGKLGKGGRGLQKRATQRVAGVLAMRAATSAALSGEVYGVHGADPSVVENLCDSLRQIFRNHGAVHLKTPLLRPRRTATAQLVVAGPVELLNSRGVVLTLPQDLTAALARSVGRGGAATANLKRFDIDRVYQKSGAGGHPRENMEASFDIIQEDHRRAVEIQAETMLVVQQVISLLRSDKHTNLPFDAELPLWFLRIGHTRFADSILDLCGVPPKESIRKYVFDLISHYLAPSPYVLGTYGKGTAKTRAAKSQEDIVKNLEHAVSEHGLPEQAVTKIQVLFAEAPMSIHAGESIAYLRRVLSRLRSTSRTEVPDAKRLKRFEDSARNLKALSDLIDLIELHLQPYFSRSMATEARCCRPLFLSIDLGLRQPRRTYHGGVIFQAIVLQDTFFENPKENDFSSSRGTKVATGGEFSELVRKNRPPGNFATTFPNHYTASPIPFCFGVEFSVGKLVEKIYESATVTSHVDGSSDVSSICEISQMRKLLGHPLNNADSVDVVVASAQGMDSSYLRERFDIASRLWTEGVAAEYLAQSGVMLSLLKRIRDRDDYLEPATTTTSDWSLLELYGVCALLKIRYVVIVQPHLLREKNSVRLIRVVGDTAGNSSSVSSESFVSLDNLAGSILDGLRTEATAAVDFDHNQNVPATQATASNSKAARVRVNCILIESDVYYGGDHDVSKSETPHWKPVMKTIKKVEFQAENFLFSMGEQHQESGMDGVPVFAVSDASFWALRDFGTALMRLESKEESATGAYLETAEKYPKYKRSLKTLADSIDHYMRKAKLWTTNNNSNRDGTSSSTSSLLTALLYSKNDDRFDVITLNLQSHSRKLGGHSSRRK